MATGILKKPKPQIKQTSTVVPWTVIFCLNATLEWTTLSNVNQVGWQLSGILWLTGENLWNGNCCFKKAQTQIKQTSTVVPCAMISCLDATLECTTLSNVNRVGWPVSGILWLTGEKLWNGNCCFEKAQTPDQTNIHCCSVHWDLLPTLECTTLSYVNWLGLGEKIREMATVISKKPKPQIKQTSTVVQCTGISCLL